MCDVGITAENFNPRILYVLKRDFSFERKITQHSHDFASLIYILSGTCTYIINDITYRVNKDDVIIINAGTSHGKVVSAVEEVEEFHLGFNNICLKNLAKNCLIEPDISPVINLNKYGDDFINCCNEIIVEQEKGGPGCELLLKAMVMKLIAIVLKASYIGEYYEENKNVSFDPYDKANMVKAIISFIDDNYMKEVSLNKIARNMYVSPIYISKIFKEETGDSPINYLIKKRLSKAKEMLDQGSVSIRSIAKNVGYDDPYHFSKLFKKYFGCPPSKYISR